MTNLEKYAEEIKNYNGDNFCGDFIRPIILKTEHCRDIGCTHCALLQVLWLDEEYTEPEEPETDWSKVEVDTPILVRDVNHQDWERGYFAEYENGYVYAWKDGRTSWTTSGVEKKWKYAKLAEGEDE